MENEKMVCLKNDWEEPDEVFDDFNIQNRPDYRHHQGNNVADQCGNVAQYGEDINDSASEGGSNEDEDMEEEEEDDDAM